MITISGGSDIRDVESRAHGLAGVAEVRDPDGGEWHRLLVRSGNVSLTEIGELPARTARVSVMSWSDETDDVTDWLTPFGAWIRLWHKIERVGGTIIMVPLGYYRVDTMDYNPLDGTIDVTASDAGALVVDYALPTLADGQVTTAQTYLARLSTMLNDALAGTPPWWTAALDAGPASATAKPQTRLQYTGDRSAAVINLAARLGCVLTTPLDGSAAFRLAVARNATDPSDVTVRGGQLGNLVELASQVNREGIANVALVLYTREVRLAGARTRVEQRRLVEAYTNPDADTAAYGPFGTVTVDVESTNIADDPSALTAADAVLKASLTQARDVAAEVSPVYGLESGDIVRVEDAQGIATVGILTAGELGVSAGDGWHLTVRTFVPVGKWSGVRRTVLTDAYEVRDDADWQDFGSKSVDLTGQSVKGWLAGAGAIKDGGTRILFTANGSAGARIYTLSTFAVPTEHRLRVVFSVKNVAKSGSLRARAYIDPNQSGARYGPYVTIPANKTRSIKAELDVGAGSTFTLGVGVERSNGAALASGAKVYVSNVNVERAIRRPT